MTTQIEFYDKDIIKNTLGVLTVKPDKVIYIYDNALDDMYRFVSLEKCFKKHLPNIILEKYPVNILKMNDIYKKVCEVIDENGNCIIDLTGGSELMVIAGYKAGTEKGAKLVYTDIIEEKLVNIENENDFVKTEMLTLSDFVDARGSDFIGNSHAEPDEKDFDNILKMCRYIFNHLSKWRNTCGFFQTAMADSAPSQLDLRVRAEIYQKDGRHVSPDKDMLYEFQKMGFIRDLYFSGKYVVLSFVSKLAKSYLINYGVWLELFVYINAVKSGVFQDVKLGAMIDWDAYDGYTVAGNEIDIILMDKSMPVFISCKLKDADTPALNELLIAKKRLGGWFSKAIIVTFGNDKELKTGTYRRSRELGIEMLGKEDILSDNFQDRLIKTVRGHNLISLKWKKV
ncbi:DUF1887 family CARF protein [Anaerotignum faecicola]|nr:DUF1887 family CARF protein [Anaerotignum faecicola]